jgi:hypothetical protein
MAEWRERPSLLLPRKAHDGAIVNGHILVAGGVTDDAQPVVVDAVETRRTAGRGEWQSLPPMITARGNPAAAALDGMVYVAGGANSTGFLEEVERFDPRADVDVRPLVADKTHRTRGRRAERPAVHGRRH